MWMRPLWQRLPASTLHFAMYNTIKECYWVCHPFAKYSKSTSRVLDTNQPANSCNTSLSDCNFIILKNNCYFVKDYVNRETFIGHFKALHFRSLCVSGIYVCVIVLQYNTTAFFHIIWNTMDDKSYLQFSYCNREQKAKRVHETIQMIHIMWWQLSHRYSNSICQWWLWDSKKNSLWTLRYILSLKWHKNILNAMFYMS